MKAPILDVTCGGRMMWFDKDNPNCLYVDNRKLHDVELCDGRKFSINPDVLADFTNLPFPDESYHLVVFDPPHLIRAGEKSWVATKYGKLGPDWRDALRIGANECMRVLKPYGTLIFKWCEDQILTSEVIKAIGRKPLFGHISGRKMNTHWMTFMKLPEVLP